MPKDKNIKVWWPGGSRSPHGIVQILHESDGVSFFEIIDMPLILINLQIGDKKSIKTEGQFMTLEEAAQKAKDIGNYWLGLSVKFQAYEKS